MKSEILAILTAATLPISNLTVQAEPAMTDVTSQTRNAAEAIPRPEYPRPQLVRKEWLNLNGIWEFEIDRSNSGEERHLQTAKSLSRKITVPFCPESKLSGIGDKDFMAAVWYRRAVTIPDGWKDQRVLLHFGACDYDATVWVNGKKAGTHRGGYTSFSFEITSLLEAGENVIVVRAADDTRSGLQPKGKQCPAFDSFGCLYTRTTGIWQTVWLEPVPKAYIRSVKTFPNLDQHNVTFQLTLEGAGKDSVITAAITGEGKSAGEAKIPAHNGHVQITVPMSEVRLWEPGDAFLYDVQFTLTQADETVDAAKSYFGMRSISIDGKSVRINGKSVFQRLILDQGFYPDGIYTAPSDEALRNDIQMSMAMGFNGARLHEKVFEPRFHYWADKLGYLTWGEYPNWGLDHSAPLALERVMGEWIEAVERDFSHPSIVGWCPFNETPANQNPELLRQVYRVTKQMDPTRPVIDTSGYIHVETDIYDCHNYEQDPKKFGQTYDEFKTTEKVWRNHPEHDAPYLGQPYFVSEYGGIWWSPEHAHEKSWGYGARPKSEQEVIERFRGLTEYLLSHPKMFAFCYTQLTDVEQEQNGLYTYDRKPKFDPEVIKKIVAQPAAIEKE